MAQIWVIWCGRIWTAIRRRGWHLSWEGIPWPFPLRRRDDCWVRTSRRPWHISWRSWLTIASIHSGCKRSRSRLWLWTQRNFIWVTRLSHSEISFIEEVTYCLLVLETDQRRRSRCILPNSPSPSNAFESSTFAGLAASEGRGGRSSSSCGEGFGGAGSFLIGA